MKDSEIVTIPLVAHENAMERQSKVFKAIIIAIIIFSGIVNAFLIAHITYDRYLDAQSTEEVSENTAESNDTGDAILNTGDGGIKINGESDTKND